MPVSRESSVTRPCSDGRGYDELTLRMDLLSTVLDYCGLTAEDDVADELAADACQ